MSVLDGVRLPIERSIALLKWHMAGEVLIPGVLNVGDINKTDGCRQAAEPKRLETRSRSFSWMGRDIHGCKGCFDGDNSRDCPCVQKDGFDHLRWNNLGHVLAGGNMAVGDIEGKREIQEAYTLGKKII